MHPHSLNLLPWPQKLQMTSGSSALPAGFVIKPEAAAAWVADVLADDVRELGFSPRISAEAVAGVPSVSLMIDDDPDAGDESYSLTVEGDISVSASTERGLFWGTRTLLQLLVEGPDSEIPNLQVMDRPEYGYRGCMVDTARKFHSIEFHRQMIKRLAAYKINIYHIHFTDDQSYTLPSSAFPSLPTPDRNYTVEQLSQLVQLASRYHVTIVPEIDMPGHNAWLCKNVPDVVCRGVEKTNVTCAGSERSYAALEDLISETMEIFPGPFFHIGADEVEYSAWDDCPDCRRLIAEQGLKDNRGLYNHFINRMNGFVRSKGRRTIIWEGFGVGDRPPVDKDVLVEEFENEYALPDELMEAGYDLINASWVPLYIDRHLASSPEALAEWNPLYFGKAHPPRPLSDLMKIEPTERLKGVCMCTWLSPEEVEDGLLFGIGPQFEGFAEPAPRIQAAAERAWSGARTSKEDLLARVEGFTRR